MKKTVEITLLFFLSVLLCACPYSSSCYLDEKSITYIDDALLGKWVTHIKNTRSLREEETYLTLTKRTDTEYYFAITGQLDQLRPYHVLVSDSLTGRAFTSTIDNRQFLNITLNDRVYIAELILKNEKLSLLPLAENFTAKMIFNGADLRKSIEVHYKTRVHPLVDSDFCLRNMIKIN